MKSTFTQRLVLMAVLLVQTLAVTAQKQYVIRGTVFDKQSEEGIDYATVRLLTPKDSTMITGTNTEEDGSFMLRPQKPGKYIIRLSYIGYRSIYQDIVLPEPAAEETAAVVDTFDLGRLTMYSDDYVLKAAIVRASVAKVQQVGDTTVFNADAYRTPEGATLEALVKQLPGAEVGDDGSITINGKKVNEVLVNGKDFFKGDSETAMKNLPVNLVKKIKTYDKKSDYAEQTGIDDGEDSFVLDIMTRRELNQSWIANLDMAGGWDYDTRGLYSGKLFVTRFTNQSRVTLIASHNNVGDNGFGGPRGMGGGGGGNGINRNTMVAGNFSWDNGVERFKAGRLELGGDLRYNRRDNETESTSSSETFLTANSRSRSFSNRHSWGTSLSQSINANLRLQWSPDTLTSVSFRPAFSWSKGRSSSNALSAQFDQDPYEQFPGTEDADDILSQYFDITGHKRIDQSSTPTYEDFLVNLRDNASRSENSSRNFNANFSVTRRLTGKPGRNVSLTGSGSYSTSKNSSYSEANVVTRKSLGEGSYQHHTDNSTWQYSTSPTVNWDVRVGASYVEPIVGKIYGEFRYNYSHRFQDQDRTLWNLQKPSSLTDIVGKYTGHFNHAEGWTGTLSKEQPGTTELLNEFLSMSEGDVVAAIRDEQNSRYATYRYDNHNANIGIRFNEGDVRLNAGLSVNPEHTSMDYKKGVVDTHVTRTVFNVSPQVRLRWNMNRTRRLEFNFNSGSSQPSMTNLLEVIDTSDPLRISTGNAGLKPSWNNNLRASFNDYNTDRQQSWATNYSFSHTRNTIANLSVHDTETGRTFSAPQNITGHWNTSAGLMFSSGLGQEKLWNISTHTNFRFNHSTAYVSTNHDLGSGVALPTAPYTNEQISNFFRAVLPTAQTSVGKTSNLSENLTISYRQSMWDVSANGRVNYQHSRSSLQGANNMDTWGFDYGVSANMTLDCGFSLSTDIRMNSRRGYSSASMNTNELLWNAQMSQSLLKDRSLTLSLQFYDILQQQSNISRTINATMRSDSWNMALNSYVMLHVIYKLKVFAGQSGNGDNNGGDRGRGGDRPGSDAPRQRMMQAMPMMPMM